MRTRSLYSIRGATLLVIVVTLLGLEIAGPTAAEAATSSVSGVVVCTTGNPVVGVWVDSSAGGSGWAGWSRQPGAPHVAQYSRAISPGGSVSLHVGCGGEPSRWRGDNWTPRIGVSGARILNATCNDGVGTGVRCSFPASGATRGSNWFSAGYCTWGAAVKFKQAVGGYPSWSGNAYQWATNAINAGWVVRPEPMPRSVFVFQPYQGTNSALGHVGWVDWVEYRSDGAYLHTTEMNARSWNVWSNEVRRVPSGARFILVP